MHLHFVCPHCGAETLVPEAFLGQAGTCATCGQPITVEPAAKTNSGEKRRGRKNPPNPAAVSLAVTVMAVVVVLLLAGGGTLAWLFFPLGPGWQGSAERAHCETNLATLALALRQYEQAYGVLPPAHVVDAQGKPLYSWRVLILPQLGQDALFQQFDLSQPWNSPANLAVAQTMPSVFHCPSRPATGGLAPTTTPYQVVVGTGTLFPGTKSTSTSLASDGISQTLSVVEAADNEVFWTDPRDLTFDTLNFRLNSGGASLSSAHAQGAHAALADGEVVFLRNSLSPALLRALLTANGGETIDATALQGP